MHNNEHVNVDEQEIRQAITAMIVDLVKINEPKEVKHGWKSWKDESTGLILSEWV